MSGIVLTQGDRFVGRETPLARLESAAERAFSVQSSVALICGEPGIGKSRLVKELAQRLSGRKVREHWGRCFASEGGPSYWPWVQVLRSVIAADPSDGDPPAVRPWHDLSRLAYGESISDQSASFTQQTLFDAVLSGLTRAAERSPLLIVIEDLHYADLATLHLVEYLSLMLQDEPIMFVGTYRHVDLEPMHPLRATVGELERRYGFLSVTLEGLSLAEVSVLIASEPDAVAPPETASVIHRRSGGNPLFALELARFLSSGGGDFVESAVPESVQLAVWNRIRRRSPNCARTLRYAAFLGMEFDRTSVTMLIERTGPEPVSSHVPAMLREGARAGFITELAGGAGRYAFAHELVRDVLRAEIAPAERPAVHACAAEVLERHYGADADKHAAELAHHLRLAGADPRNDDAANTDPACARELADKHVHYCRIAATEAFEAKDFPRAIELLTAAIDAPGTHRSPAETAELRYALGRALALHGDEVGARRELTAAFQWYEHCDPDVALEIATFPVAFDYTYTFAFDLVDSMISRVRRHSTAWARLMACRATEIVRTTADRASACESLEKAHRIAVELADPRLELFVLLSWFSVTFSFLPRNSPHPRLDRLVELAREVGDLRSEAMARFFAWIFAAQEVAAREHRDAALFAAEQLRDRRLLSLLLHHTALAQMGSGEWDRARAALDRTILLDPGYVHGGRHEARAVIEYSTGRPEEGDRYLLPFIEAYRTDGDEHLFRYQTLPLAIAVRCRETGHAEFLDVADEITRRISASPAATRLNLQIAYRGAGLIAAEYGDTERARQAHERLEAIWSGSEDTRFRRQRGLIALAASDEESARVHLQSCLGPESKLSEPPEYATACVDYAEAFCRRVSGAERRRASELVTDALAIARELGMTPLAERASGVLEDLSVESISDRNGLTPRELDVLRHLAEGETNQEISRDLRISEHTVAHHLTSLFAKIGVSNRVDAALWAVRSGVK